jgi:biotin carboxylase
MDRVLLLLPASGYRNDEFVAAAKALDVQIITVANHCHQLAPLMGMSPILAAPFDRPEIAVEQVTTALGRNPNAVLAVDDAGVELAALLRERLHLAGDPPVAVGLTRDKLAFRRVLKDGGLNCPAFYHLGNDALVTTLQPPLEFPVVVKARRLSASRGVIRADTAPAFTQAVRWVRGIQAKADRDAANLGLIVESFIAGREYALEGLLNDGRLRVLALFDKPDPMDGPYFEETLYITPSRLPQTVQDAIVETVQRACTLVGLTSGPIHAEMRVSQGGVWLLEIAARSIGGLCGSMLRHALGMSLEELILRHALDRPIPEAQHDQASGVMMIPIPKRGIFQGAHNLDGALQVAGITGIQITASPGQIIAPPPEGASYLGFIFAHAMSPDAVEISLRDAHRRLVFAIQQDIRVDRATALHTACGGHRFPHRNDARA